jgi:hypothetical protein
MSERAKLFLDEVAEDDLLSSIPCEDKRRGVKCAVVAMCVAGGMGAAGLLEIA